MSKKKIDWMVTVIPFMIIVGIVAVLFVFPKQANMVISQVRFFFGDTLGIYYLILGMAVLIISIYLAFSKYGNIIMVS